MRLSPRPATAAALAATALALAAPAPAAGQPSGAAGDAGPFPFPPPVASPLEPHTRAAPVHVDRGRRERWVALADLGDRIPFWIAGPRPSGGASAALAGSVAGGVSSRFDLEGTGNELIEAHYRVGFRLRARLHGVAARLEAYHASSHLGDEFLQRTGRDPVSTSREGLELLVGTGLADGLRAYGGPGLLVRSTAGLEPASVRLGTEWRPGGLRWGPFRPYASAEAFAWDELGWDPILSGEAGVSFGGGHLRLALVAGTGPSRAEQFFRGPDETLWGVSFSVTR